MRKMWLFLIVVAFFFIIPSFSASAERGVYDEESLREAIAAGGTVYLGTDIEITSPIEITKDVQIYGDYNKIYSNEYNSIFIVKDGTAIFKELDVESEKNPLVVYDGEVLMDNSYIVSYNSSPIVLYNGKFIVGNEGLYLNSYNPYITFPDNPNGKIDIDLYGDIAFYTDVEVSFYINPNAPEINIQNINNEYKFSFSQNKLKFDGDYYTLYSNEVSDENRISIDGHKYTHFYTVTTEDEFINYINQNKSVWLGADITLTKPLTIKDKSSIIFGDGWAIRQNDGATFSITGDSNIIINGTWFIGLGQLEINDGAVVTYDDMETFDNPSTLNLNGGTLIIKEMRLYKDFNINIHKGFNTITNGAVLVLENQEPIQSWLGAKLNINIDNNVIQLRLSSENSINKMALNGQRILVDLEDKTNNSKVTMESNPVDCCDVSIDGEESFVGDKAKCRVSNPEIVEVPNTSLFSTMFTYSGITLIIVGVGDILVNLKRRKEN